MARPFSKSLEEQLAATQEELKKTEEKVVSLKQKITELNHAIRERDKELVFAAIEAKSISINDVIAMLESKTDEDKVVELKPKKRA